MKKIVSALTLAAALVAGVSIVSCSSSGGDSDVIKIGVFEPLTGANGAGGADEYDGIKLANKLNPTILGKKIVLVAVDNKAYDPIIELNKFVDALRKKKSS